MGKLMSQEEKRYIEEMGGKMKNTDIAKNLTFLYGNTRRACTVASYLARLNDRAAPKASRNASVFVPGGKPVIRNNTLLIAMEATETSCREIARGIGLSQEQVQGMLANGGIPKSYTEPVRVFFKERGERV